MATENSWSCLHEICANALIYVRFLRCPNKNETCDPDVMAPTCDRNGCDRWHDRPACIPQHKRRIDIGTATEHSAMQPKRRHQLLPYCSDASECSVNTVFNVASTRLRARSHEVVKHLCAKPVLISNTLNYYFQYISLLNIFYAYNLSGTIK